MKRRNLFIAAVLTLTLALSACAPAESGTKPTPTNAPAPGQTTAVETPTTPKMEPKTLMFATQSIGAASYARVEAMAAIIERELPEGWKVEASPVSTGGVASALLVEQGQTDMGSSVNVSAKMLMEGGYEGVTTLENTLGVWGGTDYCYYLIMFTEEFQRESGATTLEELFENKVPFRLVTKAPGSSGEQGANDLLKVLGYSYDDVRKFGGETYHIDPTQMADMLKEGKADVSIDVLSLGQPAMTELTMTSTMYFPQLRDSTLELLTGAGYPTRTMPANSWTGQTSDMKTGVNCDSIVIRKEVPDEVVYAIAKAICEGSEELAERIPATAPFKPEEACDPLAVGIELHPGAIQYYKDVGYMK